MTTHATWDDDFDFVEDFVMDEIRLGQLQDELRRLAHGEANMLARLEQGHVAQAIEIARHNGYVLGNCLEIAGVPGG